MGMGMGMGMGRPDRIPRLGGYWKRHRQALDPGERSRWHFLWLLARSLTATAVADKTVSKEVGFPLSALLGLRELQQGVVVVDLVRDLLVRSGELPVAPQGGAHGRLAHVSPPHCCSHRRSRLGF